MKKIIFVVDFLRTINAGTEHQLAHLLWNLPSRGFSVHLVSLQNSPFLANEAKSLFPVVKVTSLDGKSDVSRSAGALVKLFRIFRDEKPDIIHTFFPTSNSIGILLARLSGVKTLISSRRDMGYNLSKVDIIKLRAANLCVSAVIANAHAVQERTVFLEKIRPEKIHVVYNGIECPASRVRNHDPIAGPVIAIVANLNRQVKRVDVFIRASALVCKEFPSAQFWVIGDGHLKPDLEMHAADLGLGAQVVFLGRRGDVPELLKRVAVGVLSSDSEGLSNAVMEYMANGIPSVVTAVGGNAELVQDGITGYVVPPDNPEAMAEAIRTLLKSPERAAQMGIAGFEIIKETLSIEKMIDQTIGIYQNP